MKGPIFVNAAHPDQITKMTLPGKTTETPNLPSVLRVIGKLSWTGFSRLMPAPQGTPDEPKAITDARQAKIGPNIQCVIAETTALPTIFAQGGKLRTLGDRPIVMLIAMKANSREELQAQGLKQADIIHSAEDEVITAVRADGTR